MDLKMLYDIRWNKMGSKRNGPHSFYNRSTDLIKRSSVENSMPEANENKEKASRSFAWSLL